MARVKKTRDEARPPKTKEELDKMRVLYEICESLDVSPLERPMDIWPKERVCLTIVHYPRKRKHRRE